VVDYDAVANADAYDLRLHDAGEAVALEKTDGTRGTTLTIEGTAGAR
jgi:hypothetical protein